MRQTDPPWLAADGRAGRAGAWGGPQLLEVLVGQDVLARDRPVHQVQVEVVRPELCQRLVHLEQGGTGRTRSTAKAVLCVRVSVGVRALGVTCARMAVRPA